MTSNNPMGTADDRLQGQRLAPTPSSSLPTRSLGNRSGRAGSGRTDFDYAIPQRGRAALPWPRCAVLRSGYSLRVREFCPVNGWRRGRSVYSWVEDAHGSLSSALITRFECTMGTANERHGVDVLRD